MSWTPPNTLSNSFLECVWEQAECLNPPYSWLRMESRFSELCSRHPRMGVTMATDGHVLGRSCYKG